MNLSIESFILTYKLASVNIRKSAPNNVEKEMNLQLPLYGTYQRFSHVVIIKKKRVLDNYFSSKGRGGSHKTWEEHLKLNTCNGGHKILLIINQKLKSLSRWSLIYTHQ